MKHSHEPPRAFHGLMPIWGLLAFCAVGLGCFSFLAGGFASDLGGDPDEAAHAVTALMVRDYLAEGLGTHPMQFAKAYYEDFPRVALGHYPPLYYCVAAPLLLIRPSTDTLMILQAVSVATLALLTSHIGSKLFPRPLAAAAGIGVILLPLALKLSLHVMSDVLLALLCLWAAILWASYMLMPSISRALIWGCVAAAAILTKGSGIGLCLLPPVATLLAGKWRLALTGSWWCSALPVALLAGPWMLFSTSISKEGMTLLSPWQYFLEALPYHLKAMPMVFGWPFTILASAGIVGGLITGWRRKRLLPETASLTGMASGMTAVLLLVPVGLSTRYMLTLAPAVLLAAAAALEWIPWSRDRAPLSKAAMILTCSMLLVPSASLHKEVSGFNEAVMRSGITSLPDSEKNWLVASDPRGEGAVIAAAAFAIHQRAPSPLSVYRASKELAQSDWMGRGYKTAFEGAASILAHLDRRGVTRVFVDLSAPEAMRKEHERLLEAALEAAPERWKLEFEQPVTRNSSQHGRLLVYIRL